jgi:outer membrane protein TolC
MRWNDRQSPHLRSVCAGIAALLTALPVRAGAASLSFAEARAQVNAHSSQAAAAAKQTEARQHVADAAKTLNRPFVSADLSVLNYEKSIYASTAGVQSLINSAIGYISGLLPSLPLPPTVPPITLPAFNIPSTLTYNYTQTSSSPELIATVPIYTGGRIKGVQNILSDSVAGARADERTVSESLDTLLVARYFGVQLARAVAATSDAAVDDLQRHFHAIAASQEEGVTSKLRSMQAQAALDKTKAAAARAHRDVTDAQFALDQLLLSPQPVVPSTPLFVITNDLESEDAFVAAALGGATPFLRIAAQEQQAKDLEGLAKALFLPQVYGVAQVAAVPRNAFALQPNYMIGFVAQFSLLDPIDRSQLVASAHAAKQSVDAANEAARTDTQVNVRRAYHQLQDARDAYVATNSALAAAQEDVRTQFERDRTGFGRPLDVADARLRLSSVISDRAADAYAYDIALAALLAATGNSGNFDAYAKRADIRVTPR